MALNAGWTIWLLSPAPAALIRQSKPALPNDVGLYREAESTGPQ
jgi:hypothetical protein